MVIGRLNVGIVKCNQECQQGKQHFKSGTVAEHIGKRL